MSDFIVFKSFYVREEADSLKQFLEDKGIESIVQKKKPLLDTVYIGHSGDKDIFLLLAGNDFARANELIDQEIRSRLNEIPEDYYLYSFSTDELKEVLQKPDEWNNQDVLIAGKILKDRGIVIAEQDLLEYRLKRQSELALPESEFPPFILLAYIAGFLFPPYAIIAGLWAINLKKVLPDGKRVLVYKDNIRTHAHIIIVLGLLFFAGGLYYLQR